MTALLGFLLVGLSCGAPNILFLLTDDQGWGDNQYYCDNSTNLCPRTPNLAALATSPHSVFFHRFYAGAGVCSPTRAAILTGRNNQRDCIHNALACDHEDPAPTCAQGSDGALPTSEFTFAKAAKKSKLGDYATIHLGKWHLGDLWNKKLPDMNKKWPVSSPSEAGFDEWMTTQAEASVSMSNCGCFPVNHSHPGPKPPSGYPNITPHGNGCVVGGGFPSDWCYPCTNYYYPNASDVRKVTDLSTVVPGDDSEFLVDLFEDFVQRQSKAKRPWLAHVCLHAIHEPHPSMPAFYKLYKKDPDYLGTLEQMDVQFGRIMNVLQDAGVLNNTIIFYTADNGPHQGDERSDIRYSTGFLRQCKASQFEGGIRVPGILHAPGLIHSNQNITIPVSAMDLLPTVMETLQVTSDNPNWVMDGMSLWSLINAVEPKPPRPENKQLFFWWGDQKALIDNNWKLINTPVAGQCDFQLPYSKIKKLDAYYLFDLDSDYHELKDLKSSQAAIFQKMVQTMKDFETSIAFSQTNETGCA